MMFDIEQAIDNWRKKLERHPGLEPGYIEELEGHLRDKIEILTNQDYSPEEAFHKAAESLDDPEQIAEEYHKVRSRSGKKPSWKSSSWIPTMLPNYIKMGIRSFKRQRKFALINTVGLSVGLACCMLIFLYIHHELQYDQFHPDADQLYRITYQISQQGSTEHYATSVPGLAPVLQQEFPDITSAIRLSKKQGKTVEIANSHFKESNFFHADTAFFDLFGFSIVSGNPATALQEPNKVVLSEQAAQKYFGDANPLGKTITTTYGQEEVELEVSGVASIPAKPSHFSFGMLASFKTLQNLYPMVNDQNWWLRSVYTYIKISDQAKARSLQQQLPSLVDNHMADMEERSGSEFAFNLQPVTDIHLHSHLQQEIEPNGSISYIYIFGTIAFLVLLIACINYMNLATARYTQRAQEVGIRKTLGASRWSLIKQFVGESLFFTLLAILLALVITWLGLPFLNQLSGKEIHPDALNTHIIGIALLALWLLTGIVAGSYPALFLSSFESTEVLKGTFSPDTSGAGFRRGLVLFQFAVSAILIVGAITVYQQLNFAQNKPLGFEREQVLVIPNGSSLFNNVEPNTVKQELQSHSSIKQVAFASHYPSRVLSNNTMIRPQGAPDDARFRITINNVSPDFQELLKLNMADGREFSNNIVTDSSAFVINEATAGYLGWDDPIGKTISSVDTSEVLGNVIGVVENFHVHSIHQEIEPMIFALGTADQFEFTLVKFDEKNLSTALSHLENQWNKFDPDRPFEYAFLNDQYEALYQSEQRLGKLITVFSGLAIFIACLGLFGLAAFIAQRRTKEIGIRKVLGASVSSIVQLLARDFLKLVLISLIIAIPTGWYIMNQWLQNFAYRIEIGIEIFVSTGFIVLSIAILTVSWQALQAALRNPAHSLRSE